MPLKGASSAPAAYQEFHGLPTVQELELSDASDATNRSLITRRVSDAQSSKRVPRGHANAIL